jgi:hypothetical protein
VLEILMGPNIRTFDRGVGDDGHSMVEVWGSTEGSKVFGAFTQL